jgi:hypothetical protein
VKNLNQSNYDDANIQAKLRAYITEIAKSMTKLTSSKAIDPAVASRLNKDSEALFVHLDELVSVFANNVC